MNHELLYPEILVGSDRHITIANSLGVLAYRLGGIDTEAAILGEPV